MLHALGTAVALILLAGYAGWSELSVEMVLLIAGPTLVPVALLAAFGKVQRAALSTVVAATTAGWAYVGYIDERSYEGADASFAVLIGWFVCLVATVIALVAGIISLVRSRTRDRGQG